MTAPQLRTFVLPDGRDLEVWLAGPEHGVPLVDHHGTPGCGRPAAHLQAAAQRHQLRVIAPTRPGYGGSSPHPGRRVASVAADVAAVLDQLGVDRFLVAGTSGGGPHALATAALLPDRVIAAASIAGLGPYHAPGLDFLTGMGQENLDELGAAMAGPQQLREYLERERPQVLDATPEQLITAMHTLLPAVDRAVLSGQVGVDLAASFAHALAPGVEGWLEDDLAFLNPWGFELAGLAELTRDDVLAGRAVPVAIWQGGVDLMVPAAHGAWLAGQLPGAQARLLPEEGHISIAVGHLDDILADLLAAVTA